MGKNKQRKSDKDKITGLTVDVEGVGKLQSDRVYSKGSALSNFFQNPYATAWDAEIEFGDKNYIVMTIRATEPNQTFHPTYTTRLVIEGDFQYKRNKLTSARVDRTAQVSDGPFGWGVINSYGDLKINQTMSTSSWGASLSGPGTITASYQSDNGLQTGDVTALNAFGGGKFFYQGWESNPFDSDLL